MKYNEFVAREIDRAGFEAIKLTLTYIGEDTFPEDYCGALRVRRECVDGPESRTWRISFSVRTVTPGEVNWEEVASGEYAVVDGSDDAVRRINVMKRKFDIFKAGYNALDSKKYPNSTLLMLCRAAQIAHEKELRVEPFINNEMFCEMDTDHVEVISILPVMGAQYEDIHRTDHLVISRKLEIGTDAEEELLTAWPIVICDDMIAFNQFVPGPVMSGGNLRRTADVLDINTKDIHFSANSQFELDYNPSTGTGTMRKYHPEHSAWVVYSIDPVAIRPVKID
ncbi:MAG: hypothetical protein ACRDDY_13770 [Clostridium sp.]|uniref:hypothetical protein n=1 Tax=Clostridium sp. TaxID=1506 RepID=UPI003EE71D07